MLFLTLKAYWKLVHFDRYLMQRDFSGLYHEVRSFPISQETPPPDAIERVCSAVDMACIWYWETGPVPATIGSHRLSTETLRYTAQLVIGAQQIPFKAHAWVEVDRRVVNDKLYTPEMYAVLDRC